MHLERSILSLLLLTTFANAEDIPSTRPLVDFQNPDAARQWQTVNDGVMGGRSDGRFRINEENHLEFFGNLSLENNGGFASVRSRNTALKLRSGDTIVIKVRGDGREYTLNLYTPKRRMAFSYRATFQTKNGEWSELRVPLSKFVATSFGRVVSNSPLRPDEVNGIGVLLGDKKAGPFKIEIESLSVTATGN